MTVPVSGDAASEESAGGETRRSVLTKIGVGAAVAWVAPTILSSPAYAQGTCVTCGIAWSDWQTEIAGLPTSFPVPTGPNSQATISLSLAGVGTGTGGASFPISVLGAVDNSAFPPSFIELDLDATDGSSANEFIELTLDFEDLSASPLAVENLAFTLLDIDMSDPGWIDRVTLFATLAGVPVFATFTLPGSGYTNHTVVGNGDQFDGIVDALAPGGVDDTTADANVLISYATPIDKLVIRYEAQGDDTPTDQRQPQQIGISDMTMCAF